MKLEPPSVEYETVPSALTSLLLAANVISIACSPTVLIEKVRLLDASTSTTCTPCPAGSPSALVEVPVIGGI